MKQFDQRQDMQAVAEAAAQLALTAAAMPEAEVNPKTPPTTTDEIAATGADTGMQAEEQPQTEQQQSAQQQPAVIYEDTKRLIQAARSEERRVGNESVSTGRSRWSQFP